MENLERKHFGGLGALERVDPKRAMRPTSLEWECADDNVVHIFLSSSVTLLVVQAVVADLEIMKSCMFAIAGRHFMR